MSCCTIPGEVWVGSVAPLFLQLVVTPKAPADWTPAGVLSAVLHVAKPDATGHDEWAASIVSFTATELVLRHDFIAGDVDTPGLYRCLAILTTAGGSFPSAEFDFTAKARPGDE